MAREHIDGFVRDREGKDRAYRTEIWPFDKGVRIALRLLRAAGPSIQSGFRAVVDQGAGLQADGEPTLDDLSGMGAGLADRLLGSLVGLPSLLITEGGADLIFEILAETARKSDDGSRWELLSRDVCNNVFAGNYGEAIRAVGFVIKSNYDPFGDTITFAGLMRGLLGVLETFGLAASDAMTSASELTAIG